jgi:hypothetical protein
LRDRSYPFGQDNSRSPSKVRLESGSALMSFSGANLARLVEVTAVLASGGSEWVHPSDDDPLERHQ